jgi:hypothetical protein
MLAYQSWFEFLRIESELAITFINLARSYSRPRDSARARENARKALDQIQRGLKTPISHGLDVEEIAFLNQRCGEIESALDSMQPATHNRRGLQSGAAV